MSVCLQDGKSVVSGSSDKTVRVWDAATGKEVQKLEGHSSSVMSVSFSPVREFVGSRVRGSCVRRGGRGRCGTCVVELVCWGQVNVVLRCVVRPRPAAACVCVVCMLACAFVWSVVWVGVVGVCCGGGDPALACVCDTRGALWAACPGACAVSWEAQSRHARRVARAWSVLSLFVLGAACGWGRGVCCVVDRVVMPGWFVRICV